MRAGTNSGDESHGEKKKKREMRARRGGKRDSEVETARQREGEEGRGEGSEDAPVDLWFLV